MGSDKEYDKLLSEYKGLVVTDFTAKWCGPCQRIAPVFNILANEHTDVAFVKVDIDVEELQKTVYAAGVSAVPTFTFTHKGKKLAEIRGADVQGVKATLEDLKKEISE